MSTVSVKHGGKVHTVPSPTSGKDLHKHLAVPEGKGLYRKPSGKDPEHVIEHDKDYELNNDDEFTTK
jgi:hypothetical protein